MKVPEWHFHEKSRSHVFGIKLDDGCGICETFRNLLDERSSSHVVSISFSEEFAEKALERYLKNEPIFKISESSFQYFDGPLIKELSEPSKDDKARWKKQFAFLKKSNFISSQIDLKQDSEDIDEALLEVRTNSKGQTSLFGEVIENKKKKRRK